MLKSTYYSSISHTVPHSTQQHIKRVFIAICVVSTAVCCSSDLNLPQPSVTKVSPSTHTTGKTAKLTIEGENFFIDYKWQVSGDKEFAKDDSFAVSFVLPDGVIFESPKVVYKNNEKLVAEVPAEMPPGIYDLKVTTPMGSSDTIVSALVVQGDASFDDDESDSNENDNPTGDSDADSDGDSDADSDADDVDNDAEDNVDDDADDDTGAPIDDTDDKDEQDTQAEENDEASSDKDTDTGPERPDDVYQLESTIEIDGALTESAWRLDTKVTQVVFGVLDDEVLFDLLWDDEYLYIGLATDDDVLKNDSEQMWEDDSIDIAIDSNNSGGSDFDAYDDHCVLGYGEPGIYCFKEDYEAHQGPILHAWKEMESGGYSVEVALAWSYLGITPHSGMTIGFDIGANDDDSDVSAEEDAEQENGTSRPGRDSDDTGSTDTDTQQTSEDEIDTDATSRDNQLRWNDSTDKWWDPWRLGRVTLLDSPR